MEEYLYRRRDEAEPGSREEALLKIEGSRVGLEAPVWIRAGGPQGIKEEEEEEVKRGR